MAKWNLQVFLFISAVCIITAVPIYPNQVPEIDYYVTNQRDQINLQQKENKDAQIETIIVPFDEESENQKDEIMKTANAMVFRPYFKGSMPRTRFYRPVRRVDYYPMYVVPQRRSFKSEDKFPLIA